MGHPSPPPPRQRTRTNEKKSTSPTATDVGAGLRTTDGRGRPGEHSGHEALVQTEHDTIVSSLRRLER